MRVVSDKLFDVKKEFRKNFGVSIMPLDGKTLPQSFDFEVYLQSYGNNLQRKMCWTLFQKQQFIISLLKELYIPPFVCVEKKERGVISGTNYYLVIDGKQRLTTILSYINNEFFIHYDNQEIYYDNLPPVYQNRINDNRNFKWNIYYSYTDDPLTDDDLIYLYEFTNFLGTPQDQEHIKNIKNLK